MITPDSNYLDSIVREVKKLDKNNDEYQIKMVFKVCVDCRILKEYLPAFLKKTISEKTNWIEFAGRIGSALYNTRNSIVHAKSNYQGNNKINFCPEDQLSQFNLFLKHASAQVIKWHKRLPGYQK